jgi:hypothetical protein
MTRLVQLLLVVVGVLLFAVGVLVGQQTQRSKFDKYLQPGPVTEMRLRLLEAKLDLTGFSTPGLWGPSVDYDPSCGCFNAAETVDDDLMKNAISDVRRTLNNEAVEVRIILKNHFPEIADPDFRMTFFTFGPLPINPDKRILVAEYSDSKLLFK